MMKSRSKSTKPEPASMSILQPLSKSWRKMFLFQRLELMWKQASSRNTYDVRAEAKSKDLSAPSFGYELPTPTGQYSSTRSRRYSSWMNGCFTRSRKPKREIFSRSRRRGTKRRPQYSALSLTSPDGGKRSATRSLQTPSATVSFTIPTASSSTAKNPCVSGKASKKTMRKEPSAHQALPEPGV